MKQYLQMIHWAGLSDIKWTVLFLAIVLFCLLVRLYKSNRALTNLAVASLRNNVVLHGSLLRKILKTSLFFIGSIFLVVALLRPQWDKKEEKVAQEGRDLLIAVDISRSMLGQDVKPNRLEFAKEKIKKILFNLSCERVGLLLFSGETIVQCPLTKDFATFFMFLDHLDVETISSGTTNLDGPIRKAMSVFKTMPDKKTKIVCLFTDGEDFSTNLAGVKEQAINLGLSIFTFGIGTTHGAPIPIFDNKGKQSGFEKDDSGKVVMSKLNEGILRNLSQQTGGKYIHATAGSQADVAEFITLVQKFEKDAMQDACVQKYQEQYPYCIAVSLLCFGIEWLL